MYTSIIKTLFLVSVASVNANDFLGIERLLQSGVAITTTCTSDNNCQPGLCCADYKRINGATVSTISKVCINTQLHNRTVFFNNLNYTWTCNNQTTLTRNALSTCSANTECQSVTSGCCQARSLSMWTVVNQTLGNFCGASDSAGSLSQEYRVGSSPNNFTTTVSLFS